MTSLRLTVDVDCDPLRVRRSVMWVYVPSVSEIWLCPRISITTLAGTPSSSITITDAAACRASWRRAMGKPASLHRAFQRRWSFLGSSARPLPLVNTGPVSSRASPASARCRSCSVRAARSAVTSSCGSGRSRRPARDFTGTPAPGVATS